jgi:hypothetical protein
MKKHLVLQRYVEFFVKATNKGRHLIFKMMIFAYLFLFDTYFAVCAQHTSSPLGNA